MQLKEFEGRRFLDIRRYYLERGTGELKPTRKGIAINERALGALSSALNQDQATIIEWLRTPSEAGSDDVDRSMAMRREAAEAVKHQSYPFTMQEEARRSQCFFEVRHGGGDSTVVVNNAHPFGRLMRQREGETDESRDVRRVIGMLLASYSQAKSLFDDLDGVTVSQFFEIFENEWGTILGNYATRSA